jgi:hypothetical protein
MSQVREWGLGYRIRGPGHPGIFAGIFGHPWVNYNDIHGTSRTGGQYRYIII